MYDFMTRGEIIFRVFMVLWIFAMIVILISALSSIFLY